MALFCNDNTVMLTPETHDSQDMGLNPAHGIAEVKDESSYG